MATPDPAAPLPLRRRWLAGSDAIAEWAIVLLMVIAAVASAISFDNATRFSDAAEDLANEAMFAASLEGQRASRANTAVLHDQRVALGCVAAAAGRDGAIAEYSQRFDGADLARVVAAEQRRIALRSLLLNPQECADYDARAGFAALGGEPEFDSPDWRGMLVASEHTTTAVPLAVGAAVLMAVVLLLLTLADLSRRPRWIWAWLGLAIVVACVGGSLAVAAVLASGGDAGGVLPILVVMVVVLALFLVVTRRLGAVVRQGAAARALAASSVATSEAGIADPAAAPRPRRTRMAWMPRRGTWWAEVLGAITLVAFAVAVLALSASSSRQQEAATDAERYALEARQALEFGEQAALGVLSYVEELASAGGDASDDGSAATSTDPATVEATPLEREILARWALETKAWEQRLATGRTEPGTGPTAADAAVDAAPWRSCLDATEILPWLHPDEAPGVALPVALRERQREEPNALAHLVERSTAGATRCSTQAAMSRLEAGQWGAAASAYTVALLVLGLAGFLFALASDDGRSAAWPRRWLMGSAVIGIAAGIGLTAISWAGSPRAADPTVIETGASAFARARVALAATDCPGARADAIIAADALDGLQNADDLLGDAIVCQPDDTWVLAPSLSAPDVDGFVRAREDARANGATGPASSMSLGWGYLLRGLAQPAGSARDADLARADDLTRAALVDPRLSPYACFNIALATLAGGDEPTALAQYADTLASANGLPSADPWCPVNAGLGAGFRGFAILSALADLEMLDPALADEAKALLVRGSASTTGTAAPASTAAVDGLTLEVGPQRLGLRATEDAALAGRDVSVLWYHRPNDDVPWGLLVGVSAGTLQSGRHVGWDWLFGRPVPDGELRADVYVDGALAGTVSSTDGWWARRGLAADDWHRVDLVDLGMSVILPTAWRELASVPGVEARFGADGDEVAFRRVEGARGDDVSGRLSTWSGQSLAADATYDGGWHIGLEHGQYGQPADDAWIGAGYQQYLGPPGAAAVISDVTHASCPGTMVMTSLRSTDPAVLESVWQSQELTQQPPTVPADAVPIDSPFSAPSFAISFPDGWGGLACPRYFAAASPDDNASVSVTSDPYEGTLDTFISNAREAYAGQFPDFVLDDDRPVELPNGMPAHRLAFSWTSGGTPVRMEQTIAVAERTLFTMTLTELGGYEVPDADVALVYGSFVPTVGIRIAADCAGCDAAEVAARQLALESIAGRLAVIDRDQCRDATDELLDNDGKPYAGLRAMIRCRFPSDFEADFSAWEDDEAFAAFRAPYAGVEGATIQDWFLYGDTGGPRTGVTVEWLEGDIARFYWDYEAELLTAHAILRDPDAQRLNDWWQVNGALRRE